MSLSRSLLISGLLLPALVALAAGEPLHLQPAQIRALGIETQVLGENLEVRPSRLPARVVIPTDQIRLVSAPVAGLIERLTVATGAWVTAAFKPCSVKRSSGTAAASATSGSSNTDRLTAVC